MLHTSPKRRNVAFYEVFYILYTYVGVVSVTQVNESRAAHSSASVEPKFAIHVPTGLPSSDPPPQYTEFGTGIVDRLTEAEMLAMPDDEFIKVRS